MSTITNLSDSTDTTGPVWTNIHGDDFTNDDTFRALLIDWEANGSAHKPRGFEVMDDGDYVLAFHDGDEMRIVFARAVDDADLDEDRSAPDEVFSLGDLPFSVEVSA